MGDRRKSKTAIHLTSEGLKGFVPASEVDTYWDITLPGFGLRTRGSAQPESWKWVLCYRHKARAQQIKLTLGSPLMFTPEEARRWAKDAAKKGNTSDDLFDAKQREIAAHEAERARPTLKQLWHEWRDAEGKSKKDHRSDKQRWRTHVEPLLGKMKVAAITPRDVNRLKAELADKPVTANRCISLLSVMMTYAVAHQYRAGCAPEHPIKGRVVKRNKETPVDFYFKPEQFGRLLDAAETEPNRAAGLAIRFLALTGARSREVLTAHWGQFVEQDDGRLLWTVERTNTKTGEPYTRTLDVDLSQRLRDWRPASLALQTVVKLKPSKGPEAAPQQGPLWVFPQTGNSKNSSSDKPMVRIWQAWDRVKAAAGVKIGRIHDLRHTAATVIVKETGSLEAAKRQLGHATILTTQRYAHYAPEMAERTSDLLAGHAKEAVNKARASVKKAEVIAMGGKA